jgi:hypothetical protein
MYYRKIKKLNNIYKYLSIIKIMSEIENYNCIICTNTLSCPVKLKIFDSTDDHLCWNKNILCLLVLDNISK